jgi:AcrR family transcriptional regulator
MAVTSTRAEPAARADVAEGLRARKKRRTREQLALATVELVAERGINGVRVEHVCEQADIGRSTFFRYFDSKEAAFVEGVHLGRLQQLIAAIRERPLDEPPLAAVHAAIRVHVDDWRVARDTLLLEAQLRKDSPAVAAWAAAQRDRWLRELVDALAPRFDVSAAIGAEVLAGIAMTVLRVTGERWLAEGGRRSPARHVDAAFAAMAALGFGKTSNFG